MSEFALEYRTTRERVIETIQKKKAAREKKRLAKKAALLAEVSALETPENAPSRVIKRQVLVSNPRCSSQQIVMRSLLTFTFSRRDLTMWMMSSFGSFLL